MNTYILLIFINSVDIEGDEDEREEKRRRRRRRRRQTKKKTLCWYQPHPVGGIRGVLHIRGHIHSLQDNRAKAWIGLVLLLHKRLARRGPY